MVTSPTRQPTDKIVCQCRSEYGEPGCRDGVNYLQRRATGVTRQADRKNSIIAGLQYEAEELRSEKAALEAECGRLRRVA